MMETFGAVTIVVADENLQVGAFTDEKTESTLRRSCLRTRRNYTGIGFITGSLTNAPSVMSKLPPDEVALFREAVRDVRRKPSTRVAPKTPKPKARAHFTRADQQAVLRESLEPSGEVEPLETGDELSFRRDSITPRMLRRLRSGEFAVAAEIDLHGLTAAEARAELRKFVAQAIAQRKSCVRIVHGKGRGSGPRGPVLKNVVNVWLRHCDAVQAFGSARQMDGGSGAVYVLLARSDTTNQARTR